ncbi:ATP-binding protein [Methanothermococcus okinawensis]|uniref:ATP-binding protein n=1 Tax=Methanothermococcus okinawensis TaxID=155863 RepID=UPI0022B5940F|nr:ATP-binding protein [Methanothermococcus okinawensis]
MKINQRMYLLYTKCFFENLKNNGKKPILIIDVLENFVFQNLCRSAPKNLQVIEDLKINGYLIYKLFNFFISLTEQRHLSHVVVLTSYSLFINKIYNEAMLQDRYKYYLVDDFDYETTKEFLMKNNFNLEEIETVWHYFGGNL